MGYKFVSHFQPHVLHLVTAPTPALSVRRLDEAGEEPPTISFIISDVCLVLYTLELHLVWLCQGPLETGNAFFFFGFCVVKRVIFTIESIIDDINVCFGDTPQTVILCPKIHPSPWATFSKHPFSSDSLGHHPWGFLLNPEVRFTENWLKTDPRIH